MTLLRRTLSLALVLAASASAAQASPRPVDELSDTFQRGVELLNQGKNEEALVQFQKVLAMDPSHEAAYELWRNTDSEIWFQLLRLEGQYGQVAERLMQLSSLGRKERRNDPDAIREILAGLVSSDVGERTRMIRELTAEFGEFAVPYLLYGLADQGDEERRVVFMTTLTRMGGEAVPPLIEGLESPDPFLRRNVALTLGYIGDARAKGALGMHAAIDEDPGVREAAQQALDRMGGLSSATGGAGGALERLLWEGDAYHAEDDSVLQPHQVSDVIWVWSGQNLHGIEVPRLLYNEEMAKKSYSRALALDPKSVEALAGMARVAASEQARLAQWERAGQDVGEWTERLANDVLAVYVAGARALDVALGFALDHDDQTAATGLVRALGGAASKPTANLERALRVNQSGAVRGEAAVALARIAVRSKGSLSPDAIAALAEAAGREVVQIAAVIDGDEARRRSLSEALRERGMMVNAWDKGAKGLVALRSIPGVDVLLVADELPDLTLQQVLAEVRRDPRTASTPILGVTADPDGLNELYGDRLAGTIVGVADLDNLTDVMDASVNADRQQANELAAKAAEALRNVASTGRVDVSAAATTLAGTLAARPDEVTIPAMGALAYAGDGASVPALFAVVSDDGRSDEARQAAAEALGGVFERIRTLDPATVDALLGVVTSDAPFGIRWALAASLGRLDLDEATRAGLLSAVRARLVD